MLKYPERLIYTDCRTNNTQLATTTEASEEPRDPTALARRKTRQGKRYIISSLKVAFSKKVNHARDPLSEMHTKVSIKPKILEEESKDRDWHLKTLPAWLKP